MALVSFLPPVRKEIPGEPGQWMDLRKPSNARVREARQLAQAEGRRGVRDFGAEIVKALQSGDDDEKAMRRVKRLAAEQEFHADQFDRGALLLASIVAWSYTSPQGLVVPVDAEAIDDLDEATARWAAQEVIDLMRPPTQEADKSAAEAAVSGA